VKIENHPSVIHLDANLKKSDEATSSRSIPSSADTPSGESVHISSRAKEIARIQRVLETTQDLRQKKVDEIKQKMEEGSYRVRPEDVAEKMIHESLIDLIV